MSYPNWDDRYQELLERWAIKISSKLIADKRYEDVSELMSCLYNFDSLGNTVESVTDNFNREAKNWLSAQIGWLASSLSDQYYWPEKYDQDIYHALEQISHYFRLNKTGTAMESTDAPQQLKIPREKHPRIDISLRIK